jgi:hypothetical protein
MQWIWLDLLEVSELTPDQAAPIRLCTVCSASLALECVLNFPCGGYDAGLLGLVLGNCG